MIGKSYKTICADWQDDGLDLGNTRKKRAVSDPTALEYQVLVLQQAAQLSLAVGRDPVSSNLILPPGDPTNNFTLDMEVYITDEYGMSAVAPLEQVVSISRLYHLTCLTVKHNTVDLVIFACINSREFLILRLSTKLRFREFSFF